MTRRWIITCAAAAIVLGLAAGCSSTGDQANRPIGSAAPVEAAQSAFCRDLGSYLQVIDRYGRVFHEDQTTVGDLKTASAELTAARATVASSSSELADAITVANRAAQAPGATGNTTTTTLLRVKTADEHIDAVTKAERDLQATSADVDASTTLRSAAVELQAAAFAVEQAYVALFVDAGCLTDSPSAVRAVDAYIRGLQQDLTTAGFYSGPVDGIYGSQTVNAIKALQRSSNLPQTGVMDPATEAALAKTLQAKGTQETRNIAALQGALTATGHYSGPIDGTWTPALEQALVAYQQSQQLPTTGTLDPATLAALLRQGPTGSTGTNTTTTTASVTTIPAPSTPTTASSPSTTRA